MSRTTVGVAITALLAACSSDLETGALAPELATVTRGPLRISVKEGASLEAAQETKILNQMDGKDTTVIWLIEEGSKVEAGEELVRLDASRQEEKAAEQGIKVEKARARRVKATEDLAILRKQCESDIEAARNAVIFAEMDLEKFSGEVLESGDRAMGEELQAIKQETAEIQVAEANLELAKDKYEWSKRLQAEDFITATELEKDKLSYEEKSNRLEVAKNKLDILLSFTHQKTSLELNQRLMDAKLALERTAAKNTAELARSEANLKSGFRELELAMERLENLQNQIEFSVARAPHSGIVVYGKEGFGGRSGGRGGGRGGRTIREGGTVREGQNMITLPDITHMTAELAIPEAMINNVHVGQQAVVTVDTTNQPIAGVVMRRAPLPTPGSTLGNPDLKLYRTWVDILDTNEEENLLPNMSAQVEIILDVLEDVLTLPTRAIRVQGSVRYVWLSTGAGPVARQVELAQRNDTHTVVLEGLKAGDELFLEPPASLRPPKFVQPVGEGSPEAESPRGAFLRILEEVRPDLHRQLRADAGNWTDIEFTAQFAAHPRIEAAYNKLIGK